MSTLVGHFVSAPGEKREEGMEESDGRKKKMNESE